MLRRTNVKDVREIERLDILNLKRKDNALESLVEIMSDLDYFVIFVFDRNYDRELSKDEVHKMLEITSKTINRLTHITKLMHWHCDWFDYNDEVCYDIDDVRLLVSHLATNLHKYDKSCSDSFEMLDFKPLIRDTMLKLSEVYGTLYTWDDEEPEDSEQSKI